MGRWVVWAGKVELSSMPGSIACLGQTPIGTNKVFVMQGLLHRHRSPQLESGYRYLAEKLTSEQLGL